jgi:hypothetical protein
MPLTAPRLETFHRAENIGSALKGGVNVCQRQLIKEVLGPLVTESVPNFGRAGATPIQRGSDASRLGRVQTIELIKHNAHPDLSESVHSGWSPVQRTRFKVTLANTAPIVGELRGE